jgi:hypothetical protein
MKCYNPALIVKIALFVCWTLALCGCDGRPDRKKLPDLTSLQGWEDTPLPKADNQPFIASDTAIMKGSKLSRFFSISMPDPRNDSLAISLVTNYGPFARSFIEKWVNQQKTGILIDLRTKAGNENHRADFLVKSSLPGSSNFNISLIFIWDGASAYRYVYLKDALTSMPEIKCSLISESRKVDGVGRNDCFSPTEPSFDQE